MKKGYAGALRRTLIVAKEQEAGGADGRYGRDEQWS